VSWETNLSPSKIHDSQSLTTVSSSFSPLVQVNTAIEQLLEVEERNKEVSPLLSLASLARI
jgi:hypothetical protein